VRIESAALWHGTTCSRASTRDTGSASAGKWIYEFRIDMTQGAGITYARNPVR